MIKETIKLWSEEEYNYEMAFGFIPNITTYLSNDINKPFMLIVPGGGYSVVSPTEGEIVAMEFFKRGYNVGVLTYTTNLLSLAPLKKQPLKDICRCIRYVRKNISNKIGVCGFSAGGHLCGSLAVHYDHIEEENNLYSSFSAKPDAVILSYPVISAKHYAHVGSFKNLVGENTDELDFFSLEKHVSKKTPPVYIWHTATDESVPVENTFLFTEQLHKFKVPFASHIFSNGNHGLSLANKLWVSGEYGDPYTMEQTFKILEAVENDIIPLPLEIKETLKKQFSKDGNNQERKENKEVAQWVNMAEIWLENIFKS